MGPSSQLKLTYEELLGSRISLSAETYLKRSKNNPDSLSILHIHNDEIYEFKGPISRILLAFSNGSTLKEALITMQSECSGVEVNEEELVALIEYLLTKSIIQINK